jgi:hypothetical protein
MQQRPQGNQPPMTQGDAKAIIGRVADMSQDVKTVQDIQSFAQHIAKVGNPVTQQIAQVIMQKVGESTQKGEPQDKIIAEFHQNMQSLKAGG